MNNLKIVKQSLFQQPIGEEKTVLPPVRGIDESMSINMENLLVTLQGILYNTSCTCTGFGLDNDQRDSFMHYINNLDFNQFSDSISMKDAIRKLLQDLLVLMEKDNG